MEACKITFGPELTDGEVLSFLLAHWNNLAFSPPLQSYIQTERRINPKRKQREAKKQLEGQAVGTKAQQAIALQRESDKANRRRAARLWQDQEKERKFWLKQEKKKEKHKGH